jgi:hypothetical protein
MATTWTIEAYCEAQSPSDVSLLAHASSQLFLQALNLSTTHPFCGEHAPVPYGMDGIPGQGPLLHNDHLESWWDVVVTVVAMGVPSLAAMGELWLRLFASMIAPLGIAHLLRDEFKKTTKEKNKTTQPEKHIFCSLACLLSVASSVVLLTDTLYILELGPHTGAALLVCSTLLAVRASRRHGLVKTRLAVFGLLVLAIFLSVDIKKGTVSFGGDPEDSPHQVQEGLYYDTTSNPLAAGIVKRWPESFRTYTPENGASSWMPSGDSRTGLPFLLNGKTPSPTWTRVWLPVLDGEVVALDIAFPETGHDASKPVYMILHGLNGGSDEEYVKDFTWRRTQEGSTIVVMVARGLMDLPIRGWDVFHGARWTDAHEAANALRVGLAEGQMLAGVGFSMGGKLSFVATQRQTQT